MTGKDAEYCKKCKYHGLLEGEVICNYILVAKEKRGCPPGYGCNKFIYGSNKKMTKLLRVITIPKRF